MKEGHFHTDAVHIIVTTAGVVVTLHAVRLGAAWMVRKGGNLGAIGRVLGGAASFPAAASTTA